MSINNEEEHKIKKAFEEKNWSQIQSQDSWQIFKAMAEFVEGYDKMAKIGPSVSIFGSARTTQIINIIKCQQKLPLN
jgi:hypothetical protein